MEKKSEKLFMSKKINDLKKKKKSSESSEDNEKLESNTDSDAEKSSSGDENSAGEQERKISSNEGSDAESDNSDLDEAALQQEVFDHIADPSSYYDYSAVNQVIDMTCAELDVFIIPIEAGNYLSEALQQFCEADQNIAIIPLHLDNHFAGIYLTYDPEQEKYTTIYFDPLGSANSEGVPQNIKDLLESELGIEEDDIIVTRDAIQSSRLENVDLLVCDNVHCGAFVGFVLSEIVHGNITVGQDKNLKIISYNQEWRSIGNLSREDSDEFGKYLRKKDKFKYA